MERCWRRRCFFGIGGRFVGFGGAGVCRQSGCGAGVIIVLVIGVVVVQGGKLLVVKGVSQLLVVWFGRKFGEFVLILASWFVVGDAAG